MSIRNIHQNALPEMPGGMKPECRTRTSRWMCRAHALPVDPVSSSPIGGQKPFRWGLKVLRFQTHPCVYGIQIPPEATMGRLHHSSQPPCGSAASGGFAPPAFRTGQDRHHKSIRSPRLYCFMLMSMCIATWTRTLCNPLLLDSLSFPGKEERGEHQCLGRDLRQSGHRVTHPLDELC